MITTALTCLAVATVLTLGCYGIARFIVSLINAREERMEKERRWNEFVNARRNSRYKAF